MSWDVREGMVVHTSDGERLGTVVRRGDDTFVIAKGRLLPRDFIARYDEIAEVKDGEVHLRRSREDMIPGPLLKGKEHEAVVPLGTFGAPQEIVVELAHEEAHPRTVIQEVGQLRIHKVVRTEMRHFSIPVRREELVVERVPVTDEAHAQSLQGAQAPGGVGAFEEATFVIPLREERVEFTKSTHIWQEVRLEKVAREELKSVKTTVRRETAEVEERGEVLHEGPVNGMHS
ncbi:MAG TPA: YsnF/AvaK domain-containing protein [Myxococcaceae bacterium]|nr:YsnF/AvaK domain-containing protein [Myxococcaceae bacterium]